MVKNKIISLESAHKIAEQEAAIDAACAELVENGCEIISTSLHGEAKYFTCLITYCNP